MYLQITTRCNMRCAHCCYSCGPGKGKHIDYHDAIDAINFISSQGEKSISIGGGEPTLHPSFFDILKRALYAFDYVWLASNGSKRKSMMRLASLMLNEYDEECPNDEEPIMLSHSDQLGVDLSTDHFHDRSMVHDSVWDLWHRHGRNHKYGFGLRNVTQSMDGVAAQGRAKKTNSGWGEHCVCGGNIIRPDGAIKLCGCQNAPIIGSVRCGIEDKWERFMRTSKGYQDSNCWNGTKRRTR